MSSMQRDFVKNKRVLNSEWNSIEIAASQNIVRNIYLTTTPVFLVWSAVSICIKSKCEWNVSDEWKRGWYKHIQS